MTTPAADALPVPVRDAVAAVAVAGVVGLCLLWSLEAGDLLRQASAADLTPAVQVVTCLCLLLGAQRARPERRAAWAILAFAFAAHCVGDTAVAAAKVIAHTAPTPALGDVSLPGDLLILAVVAVLALRPPRKATPTRHGVVRRLRSTDSLTSLPNRRHVTEAADQALAAWRAGGPPLTVVVVDIDLFTSINDVYGTTAGNEAIIGVAAAVGASAGRHDLVARYGPDEIVVLHRGDVEDAAALAARIIDAMAVVRLPHAIGRNVSVSVGVAAPSDRDDVATLLRKADHALHEAKQSGTATIHVAGAPRVPASAR